MEIVTLIVPGFNDDDAQLTRAADYIAAVSPEIRGTSRRSTRTTR